MSDAPDIHATWPKEMDVEITFNMRGWLEKALNVAGAEITGKSAGCNEVDLSIQIEGFPYYVTMRASDYDV